jgi:hypothetical protein
MKVLKEYPENPVSKIIHDVENFMRDREVELSILSADNVLLSVKGHTFRLTDGTSFPRLFEEDRLEIVK